VVVVVEVAAVWAVTVIVQDLESSCKLQFDSLEDAAPKHFTV
jgi:hypothetical protein